MDKEKYKSGTLPKLNFTFFTPKKDVFLMHLLILTYKTISYFVNIRFEIEVLTTFHQIVLCALRKQLEFKGRQGFKTEKIINIGKICTYFIKCSGKKTGI